MTHVTYYLRLEPGAETPVRDYFDAYHHASAFNLPTPAGDYTELRKPHAIPRSAALRLVDSWNAFAMRRIPGDPRFFYAIDPDQNPETQR